MSKFTDKFKKEKAFADLIKSDIKEARYLSTNCIPVNLLLSGKIQGGVKIGKITQLCADSGWGKSMIGLNVLKAAQKAGMDCVVINVEGAFDYDLARAIGIDTDEILVFDTGIISRIEQIYAKINDGLTRAEAENIFVLFDSWAPIIEAQVIEKADQASEAVNMGAAKFKNRLANLMMAFGNTNLVINGVYSSLAMFGDAFEVPGGKRLFFNSDAIMLASSAAKAKDKEGQIYGKIITAGVKKGRAAKEFTKTKFMIKHNGGIDPYYGLLDDAIAAGVVVKPKNGFYARVDYDANKETGEFSRMWKEQDLYCKEFWIPLYQDETFNHFVESKFAFIDSELTAATEDVLAMIKNEQSWEDEIPEDAETVTL